MEDAIRLARETDAAAIAAIYAPFVEATHISFEGDPPSVEEIARRIAARRDFAPWLVHESNGEPGDAGGGIDGYAYAAPYHNRAGYRWTAEVSVYVRPDRHRRGVGRRLLGTLLDALGAQGFRTAVAVIALPNAASVTLFEAFGFRRAGVVPAAGFKLGRWWDVGTWAMRLGSGGDPPAPVRTPAEIGLTEGWRAPTP